MSDLALQADSLPISPEELAALQAEQAEQIDPSMLQTPILKIGEALTREVQAGDAEVGEFIDSITGEGVGNVIEFIPCYYQKGRFAADKSGRGFVAFGADGPIPEAWADLVGEEWVGTLFSEYPDAEEQWRARVNSKELPSWGKGPQVSTTHNFTGLAIISAPEGSDEPDDIRPVRLSLKRVNVPSARKWLTLISSKRGSFWDYAYTLSTEKKGFTQGSSSILKVSVSRESTPEERLQGVQLAQLVRAGRTQDNQESNADTAVEPDSAGGLDV